MYSYDEAFLASTEYFGGDELAAKVFVDKYALRDNDNNILENTPEKMHRRIAKEFARIEKGKFKTPLTEDEIFDLLDRFKYIVPQGSPMYGIGNPYQYVSIGNCFVIPDPCDSYLGIMFTDTQITQISSRRGGLGWSLDHLRPNNAPVKNAARTTTGSISFAQRFSNTIREVGQHGRRGASLQSMTCYHPDILEFIKVKRDLTQVTGSNISIKFKDSFMKAVQKDKNVQLKWPLDSDSPKISIKVPAKEIWNEFIDAAWNMGEPGCIFIDRVHEESTTAPYGMIESSSNPCVAKGTLVNTPSGYVSVEDIVKDQFISTALNFESVKTIEVNDNIPCFDVKLSDGSIHRVTESHIFHCTQKKSKKSIQKTLKDINIGDCIRIHSSKFESEGTKEDYEKYLMQGILIGDGCYTEKLKGQNIFKIASSQEDESYNENIINLFALHGKKCRNIHNDTKSKSCSLVFKDDNFIETLGLTRGYSHEKNINIQNINNESKCIGFLDGLLATDGNVNLKSNHPQLRWDTSSAKLAQTIRSLLLYVGCHGFISESFCKGGTIDGREITRKHTKYTVTISGESFKNYAHKTRIDQIHKSKWEKIKQALIDFRLTGNRWCASVVSIDQAGIHQVYDLYCPTSDTWITNGALNRGCGEQFLPPYASCRLMILNLLSYVDNPYTSDAKFNFDLFNNHVKILQRLGDDLVDIEIECVDKIIEKITSDPEPDYIKQPGIDLWNKVKETAINDRRTGCGFTGLGDAIAALGMKYASDESIKFASTLQRSYRDSAYESSVEMSKELGAFPLYDAEKDIQSKFIQRIKKDSPSLYEEMTKHGRRNSMMLTIAPCGSVSCMTQTTSGIEPTFMVSYTRRKKGNPGDKGFRTDFVDQNGDHWQEFEVFQHGPKKWMEANPDKKPEDSPYFGSTANEIDWIKKLELQKALQTYIDNSISNTTNLPNDVSKEKVSEIYLKAWEMGLKGVTVYRDGCRSGVLVNKETEQLPTERPKNVPCDIHHTKIRHKENGAWETEEFFVLVGLINDKPFEVFAGRNGCIPDQCKTGMVYKSRNKYSVILEDEDNIKDVNTFVTDEQEALTRFLSLMLQKDINIIDIVKSLEKVTSGDLCSFAKAVGRVLKQYIPNGTKDGDKCEECSTETVRQEGCQTCPNCGWSKCK